MMPSRFAKFALPAICATLLGGGAAQAGFIDFSGDASGSPANGFVSSGSPLVSFSATSGGTLYLDNLTPVGDGNALAVVPDTEAGLEMTFTAPMSGLSLSFGNDDPGYALPGDRAWLVLFNGASQVASVFVEMNLDSLMNQSISYSGGADFDRALFYFGNVSGAALYLAEVVDNISFTPAVVPEPGSMLLLGAGLLGLGLVQRRRAGAAAD